MTRQRKRGQNEGTIFEERPGRWVALITAGYEFRNGKRRRIRKKFVATTRAEVHDKLTDALSKHQRGIPIAPARKTVGEFLGHWLEHTVKPTVRPKTYRSYEQMVRNHLAKTIPPAEWEEKKLDNVAGLSVIKLRNLSVEMLERFFNAKLAAGNSPSLVRYLRVVLRVALNEALRRGLVAQNVAQLVRPLHVPKPKIRTLKPEEAQRLLMAVKGHRLEALFTVALAIGPRHGEALALQWEDIDFKAAELHVRHTLQRIEGELRRCEPKSEESRRVIPLEPFCVAALRQHQKVQALERAAAGDEWRDTGYVFTSRIGTPLSDRNVLREFHRLCEQGKLGRHRFHDLRHATVSLLKAQNVDDKTIAEILGHSDVRLTKNIYQHAEMKRKRAGLAKVGRFLSRSPIATEPAPPVAPSMPQRTVN